eukprot:531867_1
MSHKLNIEASDKVNPYTKKLVNYLCLAYYPRFPFDKTKLLLQELLENQPTKSDVAELGYIDDSGMAPSLQPTALAINRKLTERKSKNYLLRNGILSLQQSTEKRKKKKKKKKKKGVRNSRNEKYERTPSILWENIRNKTRKKKSKLSHEKYMR